MGKYLKKYNEITKEWEIVSAPDISVVQTFEEGTEITDTNITVTDFHYKEDTGRTTLNETLSTIGEDISKLKRNVSWLAEHGGGGSGSGGGGSTSFGIVISSPVVEGGKAYITGTKLTVEFMITGGSAEDICTYAYQFDSEALTDYKQITVNTSVVLNFELSASTATSHSIIIRAINPYGNTISPKSFNIYLSTLSVVFDTDTAGSAYKDGVYNIMLNTSHAYIPLIMTNGIENADIVIIAKSGTESTSVPLEHVPAGKSKRQIDFWKLITKDKVRTDTYYVVNISAESTISGAKGASSEPFELRIKVINPSELTISLGVNGINTDEDIEVPMDSILNYNFKAYAPTDITRIYYAAKIENGASKYLILGKYYDDTLHEEGSEAYTSNDNCSVATTISSQYSIISPSFNEGDEPKLYVKVWSNDGKKTQEIYKQIIITKASNDIFPRQIPRRDDYSTTGDTLFASWNKNNASATSKNKWNSYINCYDFLSTDLKEESGITDIDINVFNGNDASGIQSSGVPYLRIQNHAYATIDFSKYEKELKLIPNSEMSNSQGFTFSICVKADNHTDTNHTIFLWGANNANGTLNNGIRIDINKIYWKIIEKTEKGSLITHTLSCNFACEEINAIDFSFTKGNSSEDSTARIYINGILNAAINLYQISDTYVLPNMAYIGVNYANNILYNYSDINVYDFSIYSKTLNDLQIVVNGKNSRLNGKSTDPAVIEDYKLWKIKNFITANELTPSIPESAFFSGENYKSDFDAAAINNIAQQSNIPTLSLFFDSTSEFTSSFFYEKKTKEDTGTTYNCQGSYYDPSTNKMVDSMKLKVSLQGTSTLGYRIKNLEMYIDDTTIIEGVEKTKLFQPKKEWFPESQFTLKADVVDSAHANNAVLGEWINTCGMLDNNPAMSNFNDNTRPKDVDDKGVVHTHTRIKAGVSEEIDFDENVTIKHTLEGFPILLFIKFGGPTAGQNYNFIGIYSFNLGRYSYYNMGMKFLKNFSRRSDPDGLVKESCPKLINYYIESPNLNNISGENIYSFEFDNAGNLQVAEYPVWSQYDKTVVKTYGGFKYPSSVSETTWDKLCKLFEYAAKCPIDEYYGDRFDKFDNIYLYQYIDDKYVSTGNKIDQRTENYELFINSLNIKNAATYFIIANAFGMTDSLGKNLTLRTWDNGETWWTCFYDMDTALGLTNDGSEDNPVTVSIDKVTMTSDPSTQTTITGTTYHYSGSKYAAYLSKLWGILRCQNFLYAANKKDSPYYEEIWNNLRKKDAKLSKPSNFTNIMANRIGTCGELIYDYDYNSKYIKDTAEQEEGASPAITFLHGTRINFVKDWLTKHFYFLDGMFDANRLASKSSYDDSPYNSDIFTMSCFYSNTLAKIGFNIQVTTPTFIGITIGNDAYKKFYIEEPNTDTMIYLNNGTSSNSQLTIKGASLLSVIDGLSGGFQNISSTNEPGVVHSLNKFDISNSNNLSSEQPFNNNVFILRGKSSLETLNLSNTHGSALNEYKANLENFDKLLNVYINNSDVTTLTLPTTSLQVLNITNSKITNFRIENQNILSTINFDGCNNLTDISIENCNAIYTLDISKKENLGSISIMDCQGLESLTISGNPALTSIVVSNCHSLKNLIIDNCTNNVLEIKILDTNSSLENISITNLETTKIITLPNHDALGNVTAFTISNCRYIEGWKFNDTDIEIYAGYPVYDISPFTSLEGEMLSIRNIEGLRYLRVPNIQTFPLKYYRKTIEGSNYLTRIFGYIDICEPSVFTDKAYFYLNNDATNTGLTPEFRTDNHYTNIKYSTSDLSNVFARTHCSINDAYYALHLCDESIVNISGLFNGCSNITVNPIDIDTFAKCTNVTNINGIFGNGCHINGKLPHIDNEHSLFAPLINNLTEFRSVLDGNYGSTSVDTCFFPEGNKIEWIDNFNPVAYNNKGEETSFRDPYMLSSLKKIKYIDNSFNECRIDFTYGAKDATELFYENTELLRIYNSFNSSKTCIGSLQNVFGGFSDDLNKYPRNLESIEHSFILSATNDHRELPLYEGDKTKGVLFPLGNSLLKSIRSSIKYITGLEKGGNKTYNYEGSSLYDTTSFTGKGILKYVANITYGLHADDCNGQDFPYQILSGCTKLKEYPNLFERVHNFKKDASGNFVRINAIIPNNIFNDAVSLENISHGFSDLHSGITCTLSGEGFKNNSIVNADYLFYKSNTSNEYNFDIIGQIPYKLLYQEISGKTISQEGITLNGGISVNTAYTYSDLEELSVEIGDVYIVFNDENNENKVSKYRVSGFTESAETIWEKMELDIEGDVPAEATIVTYNSETFKKVNPTIKTAAYAFAGWNSSALTAYTASITNTDWEKLVEDNPLYNPILFLCENGKYRINPNYSPFKKLWNKFIFDNTSSFWQNISATGILEKTDSYGQKIVNPSLMPKEFKENFVKDIQPNNLDEYCLGFDEPYKTFSSKLEEKRRLICTNYFCPPDIFRSFVNKAKTIVTGFFQNSSDSLYVTDDGYIIKGLRGTIPSFIFEPLNLNEELIYIFRNCKSFFPYRWHTIIDNVETIGITYPEELFKGLNALYNISNMFEGARIWGRTEIPLMFNYTPLLSNVSGLWKGSLWIENEEKSNTHAIYKNKAVQQLNTSIFASNGNLASVADMLSAGESNYSIYRISPILNKNLHPYLSDCSLFLYGCSVTHGTVPEFWLWSEYQLNSVHYAFKGLTTSYIDNYEGHEEDWKRFVRDN